MKKSEFEQGDSIKMKILDSEKMICPCCMEEHVVKTVKVREQGVFKDRRISYDAIYMYCDASDELYMNERQIQDNDIRLKDSYRREEGLLTSKDISVIRRKYGITQRDLCTLLGWGGKTITRYESHQVQDKAHDTILKKIDRDPEWFLSLLEDAKDDLDEAAYQKYQETATALYEADQDQYLRRAVRARYAKACGDRQSQDDAGLSLDAVIEVAMTDIKKLLDKKYRAHLLY